MVSSDIKNIKIATALSRNSKEWKNHLITWDALVSRLQKNHPTSETVAEYKNAPKAERDKLKDVGGFVGGNLKHGRRKVENVIGRTLITLDADYAGLDFVEHMQSVYPGTEYIIYSTHSHTPDAPRLRVVMPLNREISSEEYQAISRRIADNIGLNRFDDTTYQPHRLMYWASSCINGEVIFEHNQGAEVDADGVLNTYDDWKDVSLWPVSEKVQKVRSSEVKKQGNPLEKGGVIGAFCRAYNIHEAIESFLNGMYVPCAMEGRYTFAGGSTVAGVIVYDDVFTYSNHATDPASMELCNAWDLVRIHMFGELDEKIFGTKLPSFAAMQNMAMKDKKVRTILAQERIESAKEEFTIVEDEEEYSDDWMANLEISRNGQFVNSIPNCILILNNDPNLKKIAYNSFQNAISVKDKLPWGDNKHWRDADDSQLECYINKKYGVFSKNFISTALTKVTDDRAFHPIREYFESLPEWDCIDRVESLFVDYLGANNTELNKALTRKTLCAAVARVFQPGIKFDTMLVLEGGQGIGKSRLLRRIGLEWFTDSLKLTDARDKTAAELIQGYWLIEIGELAGLSKMDERILKGFLSSQDDVYRASYGRRTNPHPRQCIFIGTTNDDEFLTDVTGNRRYWIIPVWQNEPRQNIEIDLVHSEVDQIWAEALAIYRSGENIYLTEKMSKMLDIIHDDHFTQDSQAGLIYDFINEVIPKDWGKWDLQKRLSFWRKDVFTEESELIPRDRICVAEIWCELLGGDIKNLNLKESVRLSNIMKRAVGWEKVISRIRCGPYGPQRGFVREREELL